MKKLNYLLCFLTLLPCVSWGSDEVREEVREEGLHKSTISHFLNETEGEGDEEENDNFLIQSFRESPFSNKDLPIEDLDDSLSRKAQVYVKYKKNIVSNLIRLLRINGFDLAGQDRKTLKAILNVLIDKKNRYTPLGLNMMLDSLKVVPSENSFNLPEINKYQRYTKGHDFYKAGMHAFSKYSFYRGTLNFMKDHNFFQVNEDERESLHFAQNLMESLNKDSYKETKEFKDLESYIRVAGVDASSVFLNKFFDKLDITLDGIEKKTQSTFRVSSRLSNGETGGNFTYEGYFNYKAEKWLLRLNECAQSSGNSMLKSLALMQGKEEGQG